MTKDEYLKKLIELCRARDAEMNALRAEYRRGLDAAGREKAAVAYECRKRAIQDAFNEQIERLHDPAHE